MIQMRMSDLRSFIRCQNQHKYSYIRGWKPRKTEGVTRAGEMIHRGLAEGYACLQTFPDTPREHLYRVGVPQFNPATDPADEKARETAQLAVDVCRFYWANTEERHLRFDEIVSIETPMYVEYRGFRLRETFDLLVANRIGADRKLILYDFKTVTTIPDTLAFLPLDFQVNFYLWALWKTYGIAAKFIYYPIRRAVPHELTRSGRKSTSSKRVEDYLYPVALTRSAEEIKAWERSLDEVLDAWRDAKINDRWLRSPIKHGGEACSSCFYQAVCGAELAGREIDVGTVELLYESNTDEAF